MMTVLLSIYGLASIYWMITYIDRDSFNPKTYGELIILVLLFPTVILVVLTNKVINWVFSKLYIIATNTKIDYVTEKIKKFWNKSITR